MRHSGFTLVELLVGMTVTVGLISGAYLCLEAGYATEKVISTRSDALQKGRVALSIMGRDLRSACVLTRKVPFVGLNRTLGNLEADNLDFGTHNYRPERPGEGDFCEISYFIDRHPKTGEIGLWRRRDGTPDDEPLGGGQKEEIISNIVGFRLEYLDGGVWYDEWGDDEGLDPTELDPQMSYGILPDAVRVTLAFSDDPDATPPEVPEDAESKTDEENEDRFALDPETETRPLLFQSVISLNLAKRSSDDVAQPTTGLEGLTPTGINSGATNATVTGGGN